MSERKVLIEIDMESFDCPPNYIGAVYVERFTDDVQHCAKFRIVQPALAQGDGVENGLVCASVVLSNLPELPGYNGSVLMLDDVERDKLVAAIDGAISALSAQREQPTKWGDAQLMQNHYAAGFSCALHVAERQDLMSHIGSPEYLKRMANDLSQPAEQPQGFGRTELSAESADWFEQSTNNPKPNQKLKEALERGRNVLESMQPQEMKPAPNDMTVDQAYIRMFDRYEGALKGMAEQPQGVVVPSDEQIEALAHRMCSRYRHGENLAYAFELHTLIDFARALLGQREG